jgi:pimeloyl-ACP methyl ester carboxylesterase
MLVELRDGRSLQVWSGGDPAGRLVLLLPGCPDSRLVAASGADAAARAGVGLVGVNRPGYGASTPHASTQASVADDLVEVAERLGHEAFGLIGMSIGGTYAAVAAARHPDRVRALVLVETQVRSDEGSVEEKIDRYAPEFLAWRSTIVGDDPDEETLAERWAALLDNGASAALTRRSATDQAAAAREALADPSGYLRDAALAFSPWDHPLEAIACPTLLHYGTREDDGTPPEHGRALAERIPGARFELRDLPHLAVLLAQWDELIAFVA